MNKQKIINGLDSTIKFLKFEETRSFIKYKVQPKKRIKQAKKIAYLTVGVLGLVACVGSAMFNIKVVEPVKQKLKKVIG